jgi:hypothetical protein
MSIRVQGFSTSFKPTALLVEQFGQVLFMIPSGSRSVLKEECLAA